MGTRHLTIVRLDGDYRVAQYGQWDGYPSGQGATVLEFLQSWNRPEFEAKLRAASFLTETEADEINAIIKSENLSERWQTRWPALTRDTGAKILSLIASAPPGIKLKNSIGFAGDSLSCEFAYLIDLDANVLELYRGFRKEPLPDGERFKDHPGLEKTEGYFPICKAASYPLTDLPTVEKMEEAVTEKEEAGTNPVPEAAQFLKSLTKVRERKLTDARPQIT